MFFQNVVSNNGHTNDQVVELVFTLSEISQDFTSGNISTTNGDIISLTNSGLEYTVQFSSNTENTNIVSVNAAVFTDLAGNDNEASDVFSWTWDNTAPIFTVIEPSSGDFINTTSLIYSVNEKLIDGGTIIVSENGKDVQPFVLSTNVAAYTETMSMNDGSTYTITLSGVDLAGNEKIEVVASVTYDITPPELTVTEQKFVNSAVCN